MSVHFRVTTGKQLPRLAVRENRQESSVAQQLGNVVRILALLFLTLIMAGGAQAQGESGSEIDKLDSRISSISYWMKMAELGLVERTPEMPHKAAIYTSSIIEGRGIRTQDSPDIAVTTQHTIQSENSVFVNPRCSHTILNSNNSSPYPYDTTTPFYGADYFYSQDYGQTWDGSMQGAGGSNRGDPAAAIGRNGWYYVGYITTNGGQGVAHSTDEGVSWTHVQVENPLGYGLLDKNHLWIDNCPLSPYQGNLYDAWTFMWTTWPDGEIEFKRSTDGGLTWSYMGIFISVEVYAGSHNQGVNIQTGPNGEVYAAWSIYDDWPADENAIGFAKSTDGGVTFEDATRIIDNIRGIRYTQTHKTMRVNSYPVMAVDVSGGTNNGTIYLVWANIGIPGINVGPDIDIYMIKSTDEGSTWTTPMKVNQDPSGLGKEHYFPWITCDPMTGDLHVIFYDDRNVANTDCEVFVATSQDGGVTWSDFKVSDVSFTPAPIPHYAAGYFGDYLGISARAGKVYPMWTDNRYGRALAFVSPFSMGFYDMTNDPLALAYNGNRHLVRVPNSDKLHLVYTDDGYVIHQYSTDVETEWSMPQVIGEGKFPAIALDCDDLASVTWTDDEGGLWYKRQVQENQWSGVYHLWNPDVYDLKLNSPPSIIIDHQSRPNKGHILVTRSGGEPTRDVDHRVEDYTFYINDPVGGSFVLIEQTQSPYPNPPLRTYPSITRCEVDNSLHAVWQRVDTICYAQKPPNQSWENWGWQFRGLGVQSAHAFVETYGDSIFVVWQHLDPSTQKEEVYRGERYTTSPFQSSNLSLTPDLISFCPVNASGLFTAYIEESAANSPHEIYYKIRPFDIRKNISNTACNSLYPQCAARFTPISYIYTAWQDGDEAPYEIRFRKMEHIETEGMAYLTSPNGHTAPSPYLVARDSFISDWQIPVDIGDTTTTYQFPLIPGYAYKARAVIYHEGSGQWSGRIKIDNSIQFLVTYNANMPETLECWIPPALYADSLLTVSFNRITGNSAAIGPIYIYRYEYENGGGGPMAQQTQPMHNISITAFPNPFTQNLNITYQIASQSEAALELYDITGRLIKRFILSGNTPYNHIMWDGVDDRGRAVPQGVYFLRIDNHDSGNMLCQKVLRIN